MRKLILLVLFFVFSLNISYGNNVNLGKYYIGKVGNFFSKEITKNFNNDEELFTYGVGFFLDNIVLLGEKFEILKQIDVKVFQKDGMRFYLNFNKGDIILSKQNFYLLPKELEYTKKNLGENIIVSEHGNYEYNFKILCKNDKIYVENTLKDFIISSKWQDEISYSKEINKKLGLEENTIEKNLQSEIKTCENFYKMFEIRKEDGYRYYPEYMKEKMKYKKILEKNFGEKIKKLKNSGKKEELLKKMEELREKVEKNLKYSKSKKEKIKILLDAFEEIIKK